MKTWDCALETELADPLELELVVVPPPGVVVVTAGVAAAVRAEARAELALARFVRAWLSLTVSSLRVCCSEEVWRVPSSWPAVTVWPIPTFTVAIVPETAKLAVTSLRGLTDPLAVIVLETVPVCTVLVNWVPVLAVEAGGKRKK